MRTNCPFVTEVAPLATTISSPVIGVQCCHSRKVKPAFAS